MPDEQIIRIMWLIKFTLKPQASVCKNFKWLLSGLCGLIAIATEATFNPQCGFFINHIKCGFKLDYVADYIRKSSNILQTMWLLLNKGSNWYIHYSSRRNQKSHSIHIVVFLLKSPLIGWLMPSNYRNKSHI